jgi:SAM-dependent methyltransferase
MTSYGKSAREHMQIAMPERLNRLMPGCSMENYYLYKLKNIFKLPTFIREFLLARGVDLFLHTDDRRILETIIFPFLIEGGEFKKILFVGSAWCTRGYNTMFAGKNYWTLEIDPRQSKYGAKQHITDSLENISLHFKENELDAIICNGVFGWGLNARQDVEKAFQGCFQCLRKEGLFILGWNDVPRRRPFPLEECRSLQLFEKFVYPPLSTAQYVTANPNRHTYTFFVKPL